METWSRLMDLRGKEGGINQRTCMWICIAMDRQQCSEGLFCLHTLKFRSLWKEFSESPKAILKEEGRKSISECPLHAGFKPVPPESKDLFRAYKDESSEMPSAAAVNGDVASWWRWDGDAAVLPAVSVQCQRGLCCWRQSISCWKLIPTPWRKRSFLSHHCNLNTV